MTIYTSEINRGDLSGEYFEGERPKISATYSESSIAINDLDPAYNWTTTNSSYTWCTGNGSEANPYKIDDLKVGKLYISHSNVCFTVINSEIGYLKLRHVKNGTIIHNIFDEEFSDDFIGVLVDEDSYGLELSHSHFNSIINNNFNDYDINILLSGSDHNHISDNEIDKCKKGLKLEDSHDNDILDNEFFKYKENGIELKDSDNNKIEDNVLKQQDSDNPVRESTGKGIYLQRSHDNEISENEIKNHNENGICLKHSNKNEISENTVNNNEQNGIYLKNSNKSIIFKNTITDNNIGINLEKSNNNKITENSFSGNYIAILEVGFINNIYENNTDLPITWVTISISIISIISSIIIATATLYFLKVRKKIFTIDGDYIKAEKIPDRKKKKLELKQKLSEVDKIFQEKPIPNDAVNKLDKIILEAKRYHFMKILYHTCKYTQLYIEKRLTDVEQLIQERKILYAESELEEIGREVIKLNQRIKFLYLVKIISKKSDKAHDKISEIKKELPELKQLFQQKPISDVAFVKLELLSLKAKLYNSEEILKQTVEYKKLEFEQKLNGIDLLIQKKEVLKALTILEKIDNEIKLNKDSYASISWRINWKLKECKEKHEILKIQEQRLSPEYQLIHKQELIDAKRELERITYEDKQLVGKDSRKEKYLELQMKSNELEKLFQEKPISDLAIVKFKIARLEARKYGFKKISKLLNKYQLLEYQQNLKEIDLLIQDYEFSNAISELERIKLEIKGVKELESILWKINSKIRESKRLEEQFSKINAIKKTILDLGMKFTRLQISEISERSGIKDEKLIIESILAMIKHNEIYAEYFQSSKSVVFNQQANIDEIDKLMETYKEWEDGKVKKKD